MAPPALPEVGQATRRMPNSLAIEIASAMPRALKLPVGNRLSSFKSRLPRPSSAPSRGVERIGVMVSPSDTTLAGAAYGSSLR